MSKITFVKQNYCIEIKEGTDLLRIPYLDPKAPLKFGCCRGQCGTCAIKVMSGNENLSPLTKEEKKTLQRLQLESCRLACQCAIKGDIIIG